MSSLTVTAEHLADPVKAARSAHLVHVRSTRTGLERLGAKGRFRYRKEGVWVKDKQTLDRIRMLAIPPAWTKVWICANPDGHLQATGYDAKGRKQYRYHADWSRIRGQAKFEHVLTFGAQLPAMRTQLTKDLELPGFPLDKVLATVVSVMERTQIRVGGDEYAKENGSYGLSTLKNKHVKKEGGEVRFVFTGKSGVAHTIALPDKKLARLVMRCKELPGQDLFQYVQEDGTPKPIDSGMVNAYVHRITGGTFTSKDIRTWKGTVHGMEALLKAPAPTSATDGQHLVNAALDQVAAQLGNTRAVCRKYYVHPQVINAFLDDTLSKTGRGVRAKPMLSKTEQMLFRILDPATRKRVTARSAAS